MSSPRPPFRSASSRRLGRRELLRLGAMAAGGTAALPWLASCGRPGDRAGGSGGGGGDKERGRLVISNWPLYIDPDKDGLPGTVTRFERSSGIAVTYNEDLNDAAAFFAKLQPTLSAGRTVPQDLFVVPFWMAQRLIDLGWLEPLPLDQVPNRTLLLPELRNASWDPQGRFSLPWQSGIAGIAYNLEATGRELRSIDDLFDPKLRGRVGFLTEMRDTLGLLMLADGQAIDRPTYAAAEGAFRRLQKARDDGQIRAFTGNDYQDDLLAGNFAACVAWSGDVAQLAMEQPKLRFVVPESGGVLWADLMVMPKGAPHRNAAAAWMNFVYDPVNAARIAAVVNYISPVQGVQTILARDPATAPLSRNPQMFPDASMRARLYSFGPLSAEEEARFDERFATIVAS
jgi:spermidine/putrescine transport system substrate-binding protein